MEGTLIEVSFCNFLGCSQYNVGLDDKVTLGKGPKNFPRLQKRPLRKIFKPREVSE